LPSVLFRSVGNLVLQVVGLMIAAELAQRRLAQIEQNVAQLLGFGIAFLQPAPFYTGFHVMVLKPIAPMSNQEKLWWAMCITANRFRFGFGRQANRTLKDLVLPNPTEKPDWIETVAFDTSFAANLNELKDLSAQTSKLGLSDLGDERCCVKDLFEVP
jgi:hypothetical protein